MAYEMRVADRIPSSVVRCLHRPSGVIRAFLFIAIIGFSLGLGSLLPLPAVPERQAASISEDRSGSQKKAAGVAQVRTEKRRNAPGQNPQTQEESEQKRLTQLERGYVLFDDAEQRATIIETISDLETAAIVPALGRLFAIETDHELKESLIDAVGWSDTTDDVKATVYAAALAPTQPANVRLAAIEGLAELEPKEALPLLRLRAEDSDQEVRDAALEAIRSFDNP